jgi:hypothetical protein
MKKSINITASNIMIIRQLRRPSVKCLVFADVGMRFAPISVAQSKALARAPWRKAWKKKDLH